MTGGKLWRSKIIKTSLFPGVGVAMGQCYPNNVWQLLGRGSLPKHLGCADLRSDRVITEVKGKTATDFRGHWVRPLEAAEECSICRIPSYKLNLPRQKENPKK